MPGPDVGRQGVEVADDEVGERERQVGQAEQHQHRVEVEPAEHRDVGKMTQTSANSVSPISSELARSSANDVR